MTIELVDTDRIRYTGRDAARLGRQLAWETAQQRRSWIYRTSRFHRSMRAMGTPAASIPASSTPKIPAGHTLAPIQYSKASRAQGAAGGLVYEEVRNTSASAITPTQQQEYLVGAWFEGGGAGGCGAWSFVYDGVHSAQYPVGASGLDATGAIGPVALAFYPFNYGPIGQNIPAASQTYSGGLAAGRFLLSNRPNPGAPAISAYTGVFVTGNESGTSGTAKTYSIPGPLGKPTSFLALLSIQAGTATGIPSGEVDFPTIGSYAAYAVPAALARGQEPVGPMSGYTYYPVPDYDAASSFSLTHKAISLGNATDVQIAGILRYIFR